MTQDHKFLGIQFTDQPMAWDKFDILTQFWIIKNQPDRVFRCISASCWKGWYGPASPGKIDVKKCPAYGSAVESIVNILAVMEKARLSSEQQKRMVHSP